MGFRLDIEKQELEYLNQVLISRPYSEVANFISKIVGQVNDHAFQSKLAELETEVAEYKRKEIQVISLPVES